MKPSNPFTFWISENEQEKFTFKPGRKLYSISFTQGRYIWMNITLFANSFKHVREILRELVLLQKRCAKKYTSTYINHKNSKYGALESYLYDHLQNAEGWELHISIADKTQAYKVGWANNDTI